MPIYLALGMSSEEYWNCDPIVYGAYRQAHIIRQNENNSLFWLMGRYVYDAVGALAPILRTNLSDQPVKALPYLSAPYPLTQQELDKREEEKAKHNMETMRARMIAFAQEHNNKEGGATNGNE